MEHLYFQETFSQPRFDRYLSANGKDPTKAVQLYRANLRLSQKMYTILSLFEVALRNSIDKHYSKKFGPDWLLTQVQPGGFFWQKGCETSRNNLWNTIGKLGNPFSNDRTVAAMNFGFWRYLFNSKEFAAGGSTLLQIFPNRPKGKNHIGFFDDLSYINFVRNRIAHHEPICFQSSAVSVASSFYAKTMYSLILGFFFWLDVPAKVLLAEVDYVNEEIALIDGL